MAGVGVVGAAVGTHTDGGFEGLAWESAYQWLASVVAAPEDMRRHEEKHCQRPPAFSMNI